MTYTFSFYDYEYDPRTLEEKPVLEVSVDAVSAPDTFRRLLKDHEGEKYEVVDDLGALLIAGIMDPNDIRVFDEVF